MYAYTPVFPWIERHTRVDWHARMDRRSMAYVKPRTGSLNRTPPKDIHNRIKTTLASWCSDSFYLLCIMAKQQSSGIRRRCYSLEVQLKLIEEAKRSSPGKHQRSELCVLVSDIDLVHVTVHLVAFLTQMGKIWRAMLEEYHYWIERHPRASWKSYNGITFYSKNYNSYTK